MNDKSQCQCTGRCGDDENVAAGRVLGCASYRAQRNPAALQQRVEQLRSQLLALVSLLDRMEPEVDEADRATDEEWIATKAEAKRVLEATQ